MEIRVQREDFSIDEEWRKCKERMSGRGGAIVAFAGLVRDLNADDDVLGLFLEHYPGMTENSIEKIVLEAQSRWSLLDVVVIHRIGELKARDQIVLVLVGSAHRPDAFAACEYIMDFLKTEAMFWKKEIRGTSEQWIESTSNDEVRNRRWRNS
ncbi:MAG: molybdenum cofactor biosynthesis protein MoaE [Gammaproteobacteria bacterium]|nr:molybdenum cofactor biosynthesis protein MoaE [Gammaproteobacteria bacterium]